jgi:spore cortex formation protein SpoVR/YcgB (stage V sporulation)
MNATNNKKTTSILITAIATAAIMVIGPVAGVNPVFGLGHFHEGDNGSSSQEFDKFEDCLSDLEHETDDITKEQIEDCIDSAYNGESDESSREDNDNDREDDDEREDMQRAEEDEQEAEEDLAFFGDESEDSSSGNFDNNSDFADDENSSTG